METKTVKTRKSESEIVSIANDCYSNAVAKMQEISIGDKIEISKDRKKIVGIVSSKHKNLLILNLKNSRYTISIADFITDFYRFTITKKNEEELFLT